MTCSVRKTTTIVVICVAAAFFLPTSINGEQIEIINSVVNAVLFGLVMALLVKRGVLSKSKAIISLVMLAYLLLASLVIIIQNAGSLSLARAIPVSLILLLSVVEFKEIDFPVKWTVHLIDVLTIVIFIWNILCMIHFDPLERFVLNNYIQLDDYTATTYSLMQSKPIFTFGVHNFASTFYLALFFVCSKLFHLGYGRRFLFFMLVYAVFTVLLNSTASIGTFMLMVLYAGCTTVAQKKNGLKYILLLVAATFVLLFLLDESTVQTLTRSSNGFIARYFDSTLYAGNFSFLANYPLGIGMTIPYDESVYFADSGFVIYYTMGNLLLPFCLYLLVISLLFRNLNRNDAWKVLLVLFLAELSFASLLYWKTLFLYVLLIVLFKSLANAETQITDR